MSVTTADDILVERILKGEKTSFRLLVERYQNMVFTIAFRVTHNREDAEEVAQDVFVKVFNGLAGFKGDAKFSSWLYRIAYNTSLTKIRNQKAGLKSLDNLEPGEIMNASEQVFTKEYLDKAIGMLLPDEATVITLFYFSEHSLEEIAQVLNMEPGAVKVRLFRARKKLREKLELIG